MQKNRLKKNHGFTLIELLIVIAIIGILSSTVLGSLFEARKKAQVARDTANMKQVQDLMIISQVAFATPLIYAYASIPGVNWQWIDQPCFDYISAHPGGTLKNILNTDACYTSWIAAMTAIANKSGNTIPTSTLANFNRDSWGSPYLMDLNEGEWGNNPGSGGLSTFELNCRPDTIISAGPDGIPDNDQLSFINGAWHLVLGGDDYGLALSTENGACPLSVVEHS